MKVYAESEDIKITLTLTGKEATRLIRDCQSIEDAYWKGLSGRVFPRYRGLAALADGLRAAGKLLSVESGT